MLRGGTMKSAVIKRSVIVRGHKTSVCLEDAFWADLKQIAHVQHITLSDLITEIDGARQKHSNLSSAIRLFVLHHFRNMSSFNNKRMDVAKTHLSDVFKEHRQASGKTAVRK